MRNSKSQQSRPKPLPKRNEHFCTWVSLALFINGKQPLKIMERIIIVGWFKRFGTPKSTLHDLRDVKQRFILS